MCIEAIDHIKGRPEEVGTTLTGPELHDRRLEDLERRPWQHQHGNSWRRPKPSAEALALGATRQPQRAGRRRPASRLLQALFSPVAGVSSIKVSTDLLPLLVRGIRALERQAESSTERESWSMVSSISLNSTGVFLVPFIRTVTSMVRV